MRLTNVAEGTPPLRLSKEVRGKAFGKSTLDIRTSAGSHRVSLLSGVLHFFFSSFLFGFRYPTWGSGRAEMRVFTGTSLPPSLKDKEKGGEGVLSRAVSGQTTRPENDAPEWWERLRRAESAVREPMAKVG